MHVSCVYLEVYTASSDPTEKRMSFLIRGVEASVILIPPSFGMKGDYLLSENLGSLTDVQCTAKTYMHENVICLNAIHFKCAREREKSSFTFIKSNKSRYTRWNCAAWNACPRIPTDERETKSDWGICTFSLPITLIAADRRVCLLHIRTDFISCNSIVFKLSPLH